MPATRKRKAPAAKSKSAASPGPVRREVGALICFLLSVFTFLSLFGVKAMLLDLLSDAAKGLIGRGFFVLPFALLAASIVLLFHRGRPVRLRLTSVLLLPAVLGALLHLFLCKLTLNWSLSLVPDLFKGGVALTSGGVIGGLLAKALADTLSVIGASVVLIILAIALLMVLFHLSIVSLYDKFRARPKYERAPPPPRPEKTAPPPPAPAPKRGRPTVDIPLYLDDRQPPEEPQPVGKLAEKPDDVLTPAQALSAQPKPVSIPQVFYFDEAPTQLDAETGEVRPAADAPTPAQHGEPPTADAPPDKHPAPYRYPPLTLLTQPRPGQAIDATEELRGGASKLIEVLQSFGIGAQIADITRGPTVTRYEIELESGTKLSRLTALAGDIALALGAPGVNISPVPNKMSVIGVEVPNKLVSTVYIRDVLDTPEFRDKPSPTTFAIGRDIGGNNIVGDITKLTHLLIAGTTGSGKSVCMNSLIVSILYKAKPEDVKFIMVDPKMVELGIYNGIPHLLQPVVTDPKKAAGALEWAVFQMEKRFNTLMEHGKRDIDGYNELVRTTPELEPMPRIVIIIDEMADLMMVAKKEVETSIARIAQKARACGIHLILATQRPSAQVVTGIIKANAPSRIAFAVASNIDSRIILDASGAEKLIGRGDMLYCPIGANKPLRVQGCLISSEEVERVVDYVKLAGAAQYSDELMEYTERGPADKPSLTGAPGAPSEDDGAEDSMLPAAIDVIIQAGQGSVSFLQRRLKLGYSRAARLMDLMEERGIVGPYEGSKPRKVLITKEQWQDMNTPE